MVLKNVNSKDGMKPKSMENRDRLHKGGHTLQTAVAYDQVCVLYAVIRGVQRI